MLPIMHTALALLPLIASATAHSTFQQFYVNGVSPGHLKALRVVPSNTPVEDVTSPNIICGANPGSSSNIVNVPAGASFTTEWHQEQNSAQWGTGDDPIAASHKGPITTYVAKVNNATTASATGLKWFKIQEEGYNAATNTWAVDRLIAAKGKYTIKIPTCLENGHYLLRQEIIALHSAYSYPGAQFYQACAQIQITGGGNLKPATVSIPGHLKSTDPGVTINIYYPTPVKYVIPGPAVISCSGGSSSTSNSQSSTSTRTSTSTVRTTSTSTVRTTTTRRPTSTPTAPKPTSTPPTSGGAGTSTVWGQCGGINYTGPTKCPAGTGCKLLNPYYSQCIPGAQSLGTGAPKPTGSCSN